MSTNYAGDPTAFPATIPIQGDGDQVSETASAPSWEKEADRSAFLYQRLPIVYSYSFSNPAAGSSGTSIGASLWTYGNSRTLENTVSVGAYVDVPNCKVGDRIHVVCSGNYTTSDGVTGVTDGKPYTMYLDAIDAGQAEAHVPGAFRNYKTNDGTAGTGLYNADFPFALEGEWEVAAAGTTRLTFALLADWVLSGGSARTWNIHSSFSLTAILFPS